MLRLILKENSFQFNGKHYLQTHGTAMGTKTAVSFANIFMAHIETTILSESFLSLQFGNAALTISFPYGTSVNQTSKPSSTKRTYIKHHPTIKFTAEISDTETVFRHGRIQRQKLQGKIYPWCKDTFWKNGNLPVHTFHLLACENIRTSSATKSEEKRMFSHAIHLLSPAES